MTHIIFNGTNGTGKTVIAQALINELYGINKYLFINASDDRSFKDVKEKILKYCKIKTDEGIPKIIIFDEIGYFFILFRLLKRMFFCWFFIHSLTRFKCI